MNGYQELTKNGLKVAFFTFMQATIKCDSLRADQKRLVVATLNAAYHTLLLIDDDDVKQFNDTGEDAMMMSIMDLVFPIKPE